MLSSLMIILAISTTLSSSLIADESNRRSHESLSHAFLSSLFNVNTSTANLSSEESDSTNTPYSKLETEFVSSLLEAFCSQLNIPVCMCTCFQGEESLEVTCNIQNDTTEMPTNSGSLFERNALTTVYACVTTFSTLLGIVGNSFVLVIAYKNRSNLPSCKLHIAQLAIVNFIFCFVQLIATLPLFWTNTWVYKLSMCKLLRTLMEGGSLLTLCFIFVIAIERHLLIMYPMRFRFNECQPIINFLLVITSMLLGVTIIPYFTGLGLEEDTGRCVIFANGRRHMLLPYNIIVVIMFSLIPMCLITGLNIRMSQKLSETSQGCLIRDEKDREKRLKNNRRIRNSNIVILSAFILCTLPSRSILTYIALVDFKVKNMNLYMTIAFISYVTYPLQSVLNPIFYSMVAKEWRREIIRIFSIRSSRAFSYYRDNERSSIWRKSVKKELTCYRKRLEQWQETTL